MMRTVPVGILREVLLVVVVPFSGSGKPYSSFTAAICASSFDFSAW
jgi:hypothetical protein